MIKIGVIGLGQWGPNYLRVFSQLEGCQILGAAETNLSRIEIYRRLYPNLTFYQNHYDLLENEEINAIVISTPTITHYQITKESLLKEKDVLVEKPFTLTTAQANELVNLAEQKKRILMVGHTFLYNESVSWLKNYLKMNEVGRIYYLHAVRTNLGPIRNDINALFDLAPHDVSIFIHLLEEEPSKVSVQGAAFLDSKLEDVCFLTLYFPSGIVGHIHVSWLEPCKVRRVTVIGDKKMVVFDDVNVLEPIRIYDKGVIKPKNYSDFGEFQMILRDGDVVIPKLNLTEPLKNQCQAFFKAIETRQPPISDGKFGIKVVKVLEAGMKSLQKNGEIINLC